MGFNLGAFAGGIEQGRMNQSELAQRAMMIKQAQMQLDQEKSKLAAADAWARQFGDVAPSGGQSQDGGGQDLIGGLLRKLGIIGSGQQQPQQQPQGGQQPGGGMGLQPMPGAPQGASQGMPQGAPQQLGAGGGQQISPQVLQAIRQKMMGGQGQPQQQMPGQQPQGGGMGLKPMPQQQSPMPGQASSPIMRPQPQGAPQAGGAPPGGMASPQPQQGASAAPAGPQGGSGADADQSGMGFDPNKMVMQIAQTIKRAPGNEKLTGVELLEAVKDQLEAAKGVIPDIKTQLAQFTAMSRVAQGDRRLDQGDTRLGQGQENVNLRAQGQQNTQAYRQQMLGLMRDRLGQQESQFNQRMSYLQSKGTPQDKAKGSSIKMKWQVAKGELTNMMMDPNADPDAMIAKKNELDGYANQIGALGQSGGQAPQSGGGGRPKPSPAAVAKLKAHPDKRGDFDQMFGQGAAARVLGR